ncbi:hypothetical protein QYE76_050556 [Lolium multiflorum]|uniref:Uncharacterized protein n=1 Tax=Lolium multiflorum TaxID=4521 RepID=A0AAD8SQ67_LOLMU|nr:hypothetical protein QYE76_050556 [Lolium multiflorum]
MIGRGVRRGDPGGAEGDNRKWAATRSMIRGDGIQQGAKRKHFTVRSSWLKLDVLQCYSLSYNIVYLACDNCIVYAVHVSKWNAKQLLCEKVLRWVMSAAQCLVLAVMMWSDIISRRKYP